MACCTDIQSTFWSLCSTINMPEIISNAIFVELDETNLAHTPETLYLKYFSRYRQKTNMSYGRENKGTFFTTFTTH